MSIPLEEVERIFTRMAATYGSAWFNHWEHVPMRDLKTLWGHELAGFGDNLAAIDWALEHLPEDVPNAIQFRTLCRAMPRPRQTYHHEEPAKPSRRLQMHLDTIRPLVEATRGQYIDHKAWAWKIVEQHRAGEVVNYSRLRDACMALRIPNPPPSSVVTPPAYRLPDQTGRKV